MAKRGTSSDRCIAYKYCLHDTLCNISGNMSRNILLQEMFQKIIIYHETDIFRISIF